MTTNRDFKKIVRTRMSKTGESYTAARARVLAGRHEVGPYSILPKPEIEKPDYGKLAGLGDDKVKAATGCGWEKWVYVLDKAGAAEWPHRKIVDYAHEKYKTPSWWAQMVVVGYERIKGMRAIGQRMSGAYEATKSKTVPVPVDKLFGAWSNARTRARWLPGIKLKIRTATPNKSMRITWPGESSVEVFFQSKGTAKSIVSVGHRKLDGKADADEKKAYWGERLDAMAALLVPAAKKKSA
jgi:uncharacterized protein YndB with AHSA1/START domain